MRSRRENGIAGVAVVWWATGTNGAWVTALQKEVKKSAAKTEGKEKQDGRSSLQKQECGRQPNQSGKR